MAKRLTKNEHSPTLNYVHRRARDSLRNQHILPYLHDLQLQRAALSKKTLTQAAPPFSYLMPLLDRRVSIQLLLVVGASVLCVLQCCGVTASRTSRVSDSSRLVSYTWYALNVNANRTKVSMRNTEKCSNHESPSEQRKSHLVGRNPTGTRSLGHIHEDDRLVSWHGRTWSKLLWAILRISKQEVEQLYKVSSPCEDDHQFKQEEVGSVGKIVEVCSEIILNYLYSVRIGRPHIFWSVNKRARAVIKWTGACDWHLVRLIWNIHHTNELLCG